MKYYILIILCIAVTSFSNAENQTHISETTKSNYWELDSKVLIPTNRKVKQPTRYEIIKKILDNPDMVSEKLAQIIVNCAESEKENIRIEVNFEKPLYDKVNKFVVWHVWLTFQRNEPEQKVFYTCGIDFFIRDDTREAIVETFRMYGPC